MNRGVMFDSVQEVVRDVLGEDDIILNENMTAASIDGWDSMAHINIIIGIEQKFGVHFKAADLASLRNDGATVGQILDLVTGYA